LYPKLVVAELEGEGVASFSDDSLVSFDPPDGTVEDRKRPCLASASRAGTSMRRSDISTVVGAAAQNLRGLISCRAPESAHVNLLGLMQHSPDDGKIESGRQNRKPASSR
jgi:hypothetical protein